MVSHPHGISPRIMTIYLQLEHGRSMVLISAYAPTLLAADIDKEAFYDCLNFIIHSVPFRHRLFRLCDFNARVHRDIVVWPKVLGHHSVGRENSNGTVRYYWNHALNINWLLQTLSSRCPRIIRLPGSIPGRNTGTFWTTIITHQRDISEVHVTRAMLSIGCCSATDC